MPEAATVVGWENIHFCLFDESAIRRIRRQWKDIGLREYSPAIIEVSDGVIPGACRVSDKQVYGVYNLDGRLVEDSVPQRGPNLVSKAVEAEPVKLQNATRDGRVAHYLGWANAHYGHFLLETLCRAWAWREQDASSVPVIEASHGAMRNIVPALFTLIPGLAERIEAVRIPTRFDHVTIPAPAFVIARSAHRDFKRLCERMAERALRGHEPRTEQPLYLSRAGLDTAFRRTLVGEIRLEQFLEQQGFRVVRPETLSIVEQIALFNKHRWIVSQMGSACHTRLFSLQANNLIMIADEMLNPNYILCDLLCDGPSHYVNALWSPDLGAKAKLPQYVRPVMLRHECLLQVLKSFGLVNPDANFGGEQLDLAAYKQRWIALAETHAARLGNEALRLAASDLAASLSD